MSFLTRSVRAARAVRPPMVQRRYETTYSQTAYTVQTLSQVEPGDFDIDGLEEFQWDEPTALGHIRMQQIEEMRSLISKSELDRPALQGECATYPLPIPASSFATTAPPSCPVHCGPYAGGTGGGRTRKKRENC